MYIKSYLPKIEIATLIVSAIFFALVPFGVLAGGGGGGDGDDGGIGAPGIGISISGVSHGVTTEGNTVTGITATDGTLSGTYGSYSVSYSPASGNWEGSSSGGDGDGDGDVGGFLLSEEDLHSIGDTSHTPLYPFYLPPRNISHSCASGGDRVELKWSHPNSNIVIYDRTYLLTIYREDELSGGMEPFTYQPESGYVARTSGTSHTAPVTPGYSYIVVMKTCSGLLCSNQETSYKFDSVECAPEKPPTPRGSHYSCPLNGQYVAFQWFPSYQANGKEHLYKYIVYYEGEDDKPVYADQVNEAEFKIPITPGERYYMYLGACTDDDVCSWNEKEVFHCPAPLSVDLTVRNDTKNPGGAYTDSISNIDPIDQLSLRWTSLDATRCDSEYNNFSTGGLTSGTTNNVVEPVLSPTNDSSNGVYRIKCQDEDGIEAYDEVIVRVNPGLPPELSATPLYVRRGGQTTLSWDIKNNVPATCTLTGPGLASTSIGSQIGTRTATINGESEYTLTCPGGTDTVRVQMLPEVQET